MAHELEVANDGTVSMFFTGALPWHGLGQKLDNPPTIEEALKAAHLDWDVEMVPLFAERNGDKLKTGSSAIVRATDNSVLGVVGDTYKPVQNTVAFNFFNPAVKAGFVELETAGSLRGGKRIWIQAKIKNTTQEVVRNDAVDAYFMLSNSHDGTLAIRVGFTAQRIVCANTLHLAHHNAKSRLIQVRHTKNVEKSLDKIQEIVDWQREAFKASVEQMKFLANCGCNAETLRKYVELVFEDELKVRVVDEESKAASVDTLMDNIVPLFESGRGNDMPGVAGTMWAAYNSVTEYLTWERGRSNDTRLEALWFGQSKKTNERAFEAAMKLAA